ncbi:MAG: ribonuclease P protein component [Actinomycetota bacterium]|nr:ribonuclease P protein component [Actinomycetota bacterium]
MPSKSIGDLSWIGRREDIRKVKAAGKRLASNHFGVWACKQAGRELPRASVGVITGRGFENAVSRNAAKRRGKSCAMDLRELFEPGWAYLIECKPGVQEEEYKELVKELEKGLKALSNWVKEERR